MIIFGRLGGAVLAGAVLAVVVVLGVLPRYAQAASVTPVKPPSQVVDGLYKSLVIVTPDNRTLICILTRLPQSFPHFTIPPEYSCVKAP